MAKADEICGEFDWEEHVFQDSEPEQRTIVGRLGSGVAIKGRAKREELRRGLTYRFRGRWTNHPQWGRQFHFSSFGLIEPVGERGVCLYLTTQARGIGRKTAKAIWDEFGEKSLEILRADPERVADVIQPLAIHVAKAASAAFSANIELESTKMDLVGLLGKRGFPKNLPGRCVERWGVGAPRKIREDPYALTTFSGVGFLLADRLYLELGGKPGAIKRQGMCLWHAARSNNDGHVWFRLSGLVDFLRQSVSGADLDANAALQWAISNEKLCTKEVTGEVWVAEISLAEHEATIANCIHEALQEEPLWPSILWSDEENDGLPNRHQHEESGKAREGVIGILDGSPGTGKTFVIGHLLQAIGPNPKQVALCAPTGKAAVRMTESIAKMGIHLQAKTIHSTLGVLSADGGWAFDHDAANPLEFSWIIVDEASMIDTRLMSALLSARGNAHILFVGDPDQLSPVGPGAPLRDMIAAGVPCGHLTKVHRNAGTIVRACAEIRDNGKVFWDEALNLNAEPPANLVHIETETPKQTIDEVRRILSLAGQEQRDAVWDYQVLCPINDASDLGRKPLNEMLQGLLNPYGKQVGDNPFRTADKIVCTKNGELQDADHRDSKSRVMNGEMGEAVEVAERFTIAEILNPERVVRVPQGRVEKDENGDDDGDTGCCFELGYALSVHKSQGSEFPVTIVVIDPYPGARRLCDKHWLYTAISRAKDYCVTIGQKQHVREMCYKSHMWKRKTFLREQIEELKLASMLNAWEGAIE